jgi:uncharacterized membrane protein
MGKGKRNRAKQANRQQIEKRQGSNPASSHHAARARPEQHMVEASVTSRWWRGPLPSPDVLHGYNQVVEGGAERVFRLAEAQAKHRRKIENRDSFTEGFLRMGGWLSGTIVSLVAVLGSFYLILNGHSITGFAALLASAGLLVGAFHGQKQAQPKKAEQLALDLQDGPKS